MHIVWFRQDLRVADNPALLHAAERGDVLPIYILDDDNAAAHHMGATSRVWLHHALADLNQSLNGHLRLFQGCAKTIIKTLCREHSVQGVYWNRCYEPWRISRDQTIKEQLQAVKEQQQTIEVRSFNASLLWEPWQTLKADDTPYKVFTPYYRHCRSKPAPRAPLPAPDSIGYCSGDFGAVPLQALALLPTLDWGEAICAQWQISEQGAQQRLQHFLSDGIEHYKEGRDYPAQQSVSRLAPYLHFGQISPQQVWNAALQAAQTTQISHDQIEHFQRELCWREFSYSQLYHFPELPKKNWQSKFDAFPWGDNNDHLAAWQKGKTGYPIVDAGMRELWQTGYMHNRVRMIVGSFLVKNLLLHWHHGERWFWDCLFDADLANNSASWQWVAGCGADAAPYFRIFNPITQGEKFDADGDYIRRYVPELKGLPNKYLNKPWEAPEAVLQQAGIQLGRDYPHPIVDLKTSRERALAAFKSLTPA